MLGVSNYFAKRIPKLVKPREKPFPGRPPLPPTLPKICAHSPRGRPSAELFSFLVDFLHIPKLIKNRIPQNTAKNLNSRTPDRPKVDFGMTFGIHLGIDILSAAPLPGVHGV